MQMLTIMETWLRKGKRKLRHMLLDPGIQTGGQVLLVAGGGFFLSGAALCQTMQPLAAALISSVTGWKSGIMALGASLGYWHFWGQPGLAGIIWSTAAGLLSLLLGGRKAASERPWLIPVLLGAVTAITGGSFLFFRQEGTLLLLGLQVLVAPAAAWFFRRSILHRDSLSGWICAGIGVLALAQAEPIPSLGLGYLAAGIMAVWASFPAAALAGLGLDLAQSTALPMAAVICTAWFARLLPFQRRWMRYAVPGPAWLLISMLCGIWDPAPLPGLVLGGLSGYLLPPRPDAIHRRGETGVAQVRLELMAGVLAQTQQLLLEVPEIPVDAPALLRQAMARSCDVCVSRLSCQERAYLTEAALLDPLGFTCRRPYEIQRELVWAGERLRSLKADRLRQQEYRSALVQQYQFLSIYLQQLSDRLARRGERVHASYRLEIAARSRGRERANGDCCLAFSGTGCRYYVLLCDGMGTGLGAAQEGHCAAALLKNMLTAGFPPEYALRSLNSLLALRGQAGAVTVDLAEIRLDTGRISLYKWGAAPSWALRRRGTEKLGTAMPPPGLHIAEARETVIRLSLRRGEMLILLSDGVEAGECLRRKEGGLPMLPPGELAQRLLEECAAGGEDDATVAVIRLCARQPST